MANKKIIKQKKNRKRVFPLTSFGSITIEATISITMFMMIVVYLMGYMIVMNKAFGKQVFIDNLSKKMAKAVFYLDAADQITDYNGTLKKQKEKIKQLGEDSKRTGISITDTVFQNGNVDMKLVYPLTLPIWKHIFMIKQRAKMKDWSGRDISENHETVYVTKTGSVYHKSKDCKHLALNIRSETYGNLAFLRNDYGRKYTRCEKCIRGLAANLPTVYITSDGDKYHASLSCPGLSRYIIEMDISEVGNKRACSACGG